MARPVPWKRLAAELSEHGIESRYIERIASRVTPEEQLDTLAAEIAQEMAGALGRTEDRLNLALAELELHAARHARARAEGAHEVELAQHREAYEAQRRVAQGRLRELLIQREAVGFRRNQILQELYPIPPKLDP